MVQKVLSLRIRNKLIYESYETNDREPPFKFIFIPYNLVNVFKLYYSITIDMIVKYIIIATYINSLKLVTLE